MTASLRASEGALLRGAPVALPRDYVPVADSSHALYQLQLEHFSGPLDLLLFLIRRHQVDIFDIPIAFICARYLDCLEVMEDLNLDIAAEFMLMSAELLYLKSRLLLPKPPADDGEAEEEEDPRAALVRRLLAYQQYQAAAVSLGKQPRLGRDVFARLPEPRPRASDGAPLKETNVYALVHAMQQILARQRPEVRHRVVVEQSSVRQRMQAVLASLTTDDATPFAMLLTEQATRLQIILTFLSLLELTRLQLVRLYESDTGVLYLQRRFDSLDVATQQLQGLEDQFAG